MPRARGDREVYTPQVVINGASHALGSDKAAIERAIAQTREQQRALSLPVTLTVAGDKLTVTVPAAKNDKGAGRGLARARSPRSVPVAIGRGENSGHTFTYHNVVRRWIKLGDWTGKARDLQRAGQGRSDRRRRSRPRWWCRAASPARRS